MEPRTKSALATLACAGALFASSCGDGEAPPTPAGPTADAAWPRPGWEETADEAWLFFAVLGEFPDDLPPFSRSEYRSDGPGRGFETRRFSGPQLESLVAAWTRGALGAALAEADPALADALRAAPECLALDVRVPDAGDFDHLRDAIGLVTWFSDHGGTVVLDPLTFRAWSPADWRAQVFDAGADAVRRQVVVLWSAEDAGDDARQPVGAAAPAGLAPDAALWLHTRGLRKFARPDLGLRGVPAADFDAAVAFLDALVAAQVDGAVLPTGDAVRLPGRAAPIRCTPAGHPDDPDFNNVHLALGW